MQKRAPYRINIIYPIDKQNFENLGNEGYVYVDKSTLIYKLVKEGIINLEKLVEVMAINPRKRFGITDNGDICIFDLNTEFTVNPDEFLSMGRATPFEGEKLFGVCKLTVCDGKIVYNKVYLRGFALYRVKSKQNLKLFNFAGGKTYAGTRTNCSKA